MVICSILEAKKGPSTLQLEYLKGTLAHVTITTSYGKSLIALAEQLLSIANSASWTDHELMYEFFLHACGLGSELSRRCASLCVSRGVSSPQRLAMVPSLARNASDSLAWLELSALDETLVLAALCPHIDQQRAVAATHAVMDRHVWVEVDTPPAMSESFDGPLGTCSAPPPPSPSTPTPKPESAPAVMATEGREEGAPGNARVIALGVSTTNSTDTVQDLTAGTVPAAADQSTPCAGMVNAGNVAGDESLSDSPHGCSSDALDALELTCVTASDHTPSRPCALGDTALTATSDSPNYDSPTSMGERSDGSYEILHTQDLQPAGVRSQHEVLVQLRQPLRLAGMDL